MPLPPEVCNITVQSLAFALGRWIAECLKDLRAQPWEVVYHAQAADALVGGARIVCSVR